MTESTTNKNLHLLRGHLLARNVIWNLLGTVAPLLVAVPAVPRLIHGMGIDRFGVLTLAWVVIGYFGFFDLGLGRALTKLVAEKLGSGEAKEIPALVWTSLAIMLVLGCLGAVVFAISSPWLVRSVLRIPAGIQSETQQAFFVLSAALPIVITSTGLRGMLEAHQRFREVSALRALLGVLTFGSPLLALPFSKSVVPAAVALAISRLVVWIVSLVCCLRAFPELGRGVRINFGFFPILIRFGFWMTISNVISPLLAYTDRFVIGAMISVTAIAYYATPCEFVSKLLLIPGALTSVLFPAFSTSFGQEPSNATKFFERGTKFALLALFPFAFVTVALAPQGLNLWLGAEFAKKSAPVLQWLTAGVLMNGLAQVPFAQVQAAGRPDLTAKLHLLELPVYLVLLWFFVTNFGIMGAAIAWTARVTLDSVLLFLVAGRLLPGSAPGIRKVFLSCAGVLTLLILSAVLTPLSIKLVFLLVILSTFGMATWFVLLTPVEKAFMWDRERSSLTAS